MIQFSCPNCKGHCTHSTPGEKVLCPKCGQKIRVPAPPPQSKTVLGTWEPTTISPQPPVAGSVPAVPAQPSAPALPRPLPPVEESIPLAQFADEQTPPALPAATSAPPPLPSPRPTPLPVPDGLRALPRWIVPVSIIGGAALILLVTVAIVLSTRSVKTFRDFKSKQPTDKTYTFTLTCFDPRIYDNGVITIIMYDSAEDEMWFGFAADRAVGQQLFEILGDGRHHVLTLELECGESPSPRILRVRR
jgi:hypothetical protein